MKTLLKHSRSRAEAGRIQRVLFTVVAVLATAISPNVFAETYDVVINNGKVIGGNVYRVFKQVWK